MPLLFSIVIPLYNKEAYIARTLRSIVSQTVQDFEIIVVDDGSTDNGPEIVRKFPDDRVKLFRQKNQGVSIARNNGVKCTQSDFIAFLDADDEWLPTHLETLLRLRDAYPYAGAHTTAYKILEPGGKSRLANYKAIPDPPWEGLIPNFFKSATLGDSPINSSSMAVTKSVFYEIGGFAEHAWWGEDADFWGKIALKYPISFSWQIGALYHWDASGRVCGRPPADPEPFVLFARNAIQSGMIPDDVSTDLEEYIARKEIYRAAAHLYTGNKKKSREILANTQTNIFKMRKRLIQLLSILPRPFIRISLGNYFSG